MPDKESSSENKKSEQVNIHKGHRDRLKRKFLNSDGENLEQHEALEVLLYYALPQKNTNSIAHELLRRFVSLSGVFEADWADLMQVDGIKEHAATLIKLQTALFRMYMQDKYEIKNVMLTSENAGKYILNLFYGYKTERLYAIMLDAEYRVISAVKISDGTNNSSPVYPRDIIKSTLETNAVNVILAHNHPNGPLIPSAADINVTKIIDKALTFINVRLIDHIIVSGNQYLSILHDLGRLNFVSEDKNSKKE